MCNPVIMEISPDDIKAAVKLWLENHVMQSRREWQVVEATVLSVKQRGAKASMPFVVEFEA